MRQKATKALVVLATPEQVASVERERQGRPVQVEVRLTWAPVERPERGVVRVEEVP